MATIDYIFSEDIDKINETLLYPIEHYHVGLLCLFFSIIFPIQIISDFLKVAAIDLILNELVQDKPFGIKKEKNNLIFIITFALVVLILVYFL